jgi:5-methylcytosine-specific restriction endonuclease McrA
MQTGTRLRRQCKDCGALYGEFVGHAKATPNTPKVDKGKLLAWNERETARWREAQAYWDDMRRQRDEQEAAWWTNYNNYLESDAWRAVRARVFQRTDGICEGCRRVKATQVHHLSYKNVTKEFLWELVAIYDGCHNRVHGFADGPEIDFDNLQSATGG